MNIMRLNNRISCVVGIDIFRFKKYWHTVLNLMDLNTSQKFKQSFQDETVRYRKNKLSMIQCKNNENLPQEVNDKTANI